MLKRDKQITLVWIFLFTTLLCFGQKEFLETARDFNKYEGDLKEYYDNVFPLLYSGFSQKPYARYTCTPSWDPEYAFSVEEIEGKHYILSNIFSEDYWAAGHSGTRDSVKIKTSKVEINNDLYLKIGELFEILTEQAKTTGFILGVDGEAYYFSTTDKNGEITISETWSPPRCSLLGKLVDICNNLHSIGIGNNISQTEILEEIDELINDLLYGRKNVVFTSELIEAAFVMSVIIIFCMIFIVWNITPNGKKWRRAKGML